MTFRFPTFNEKNVEFSYSENTLRSNPTCILKLVLPIVRTYLVFLCNAGPRWDMAGPGQERLLLCPRGVNGIVYRNKCTVCLNPIYELGLSSSLPITTVGVGRITRYRDATNRYYNMYYLGHDDVGL